ncbi:MAG: hypothetical protein GXP06_13010 [Alphaproteobacteria bacterium]|nr:hypothetical protein [Alphaproteobacteria bacterium]
MRSAPGISLLFFASAIAFVGWGATERKFARQNTSASASEKDATATPSTRTERIAEFAQNWRPEPQYDFAFNALDPSFEIAASADSVFDPSDDYWGLPRDTGYELVSANCSACHSLSIVMQQTATAERWDEILDWMVETQGMARLNDDDRKQIHDYLSTHFSSQ